MIPPELTALLEALPLPALLIGPDNRITVSNGKALALLGRGIVGRHYVTALRQPDLLDAIDAVLGDGTQRSASWLAHDNARETTWLAQVGRAGAYHMVSFEDRTLAQEAGQMRRDFVANVSHELKTPLTALLGFIETLRGPARNDPAAQERFLAIMEREAQRMDRLVRDLLSLSRVEANERVRPRDRVELAGLLGSVLNGLAPLAAEAGVRLRIEGDGAEVVVPGDPDQLRQVFWNLTENAIKYGAAEVSLQIELIASEPALRARAVRVSVVDDGPGIEAHHLPRLTQRFYRVDTHRSREVGGTGLGLAIVKHIVGRHRGRLKVASETGRGSRFSVLLPRDA